MSNDSLVWQALDWDTNFFGIKSARLFGQALSEEQFIEALHTMQTWGAEVIHLLIDNNDDNCIRSAERTGFHLVDVREKLRYTIGQVVEIDW